MTRPGVCYPATPCKGVSTRRTHKLCNPILLVPRESIILGPAVPALRDRLPYMDPFPPGPVTGLTCKLPELHPLHPLCLYVGCPNSLSQLFSHDSNPISSRIGYRITEKRTKLRTVLSCVDTFNMNLVTSNNIHDS